MDLKAYQSQIRELIPLRNEPDFSDLLNKVFFGESNSDKFLIKMEISRLAHPCQRLLDIRDKVTEECTLFKQDKFEHYLTKETIKVLQDNIELYGQYTVGAFEAVHEYIASQKLKVQIQQNSTSESPVKKEQCERLTLSQKNKRGAPRMFFVSDIKVQFEDGNVIDAQTSNISSTGLKIKIKDDIHLSNGSPINILFTGLDSEYHEKALKTPVQYQLIKQENDVDEFHYFYLNYIDDNKIFSTFLNQFIRINQYKYKIDVHYYYQLAKVSALKSSYLAQMNTLPIYLDAKAPTPFLFALKNNSNKNMLNEWYCEGVDQLPILFHELRFIKLLTQMQTKTSTTVYSFTHTVKGKQYFLSATEDELLEQSLKQTFINYGRSKPNWRVYHLTLTQYQYKPSQVNDITEAVPRDFKKITHMATLQRLTKAYPFNLDKKLESDEVNKLNQFVHRSDATSVPFPAYTLFSDEQRKEERYLYESKLSVSDKKNNYNGHIIDFSCSGLKIKLDQITAFTTATKLSVNLTELQKISPKYPLSDLHYRVVKTGANNILHLQVCDKKTFEICQHFFAVLIKNNAKHFTCHPLKSVKQPPNRHLIDLAEESFLNCVFFISKSAGRPKISFAAIEQDTHPLYRLFSLQSENKSELNYYPIANNQLFERLVTQPLKENEKKIIKKESLIYIKTVKSTKNKWEITSFLDEDFRTEQAKTTFIKESQFNATFYALHYRLTALPNVDMNAIKSEVRAISRFAIHLTKKLEEELSTINAMIEITDRTDDIIKTIENRTS